MLECKILTNLVLICFLTLQRSHISLTIVVLCMFDSFVSRKSIHVNYTQDVT